MACQASLRERRRSLAAMKSISLARRSASMTHRFRADLSAWERFAEYESLLRAGQSAGYEFLTVGESWDRARAGTLPPRTLVIRNDVDTDPATAEQLWKIDRRFGVRTTYYFRLRTARRELMQNIARHDGEASYHFEEVATVAKQRGLTSQHELAQHLCEIRSLFRSNFTFLRQLTGLPLRTVASHGDFVNRRLGIANHYLLTDLSLRAELGIAMEAYDEEFVSHVSFKASDATGSRSPWKPADPLVALDAGEPFVLVLVHPRQWRSNVSGNLRENALRLEEGIRFEVARRRGTLRADGARPNLNS
jgi:hypothetical protein